MRNKLFLTLLSVFLSITYSQAQLSKMIDASTPGTLSVSSGDNKTKVTDLTITGTINDADFTTIKQMTLSETLIDNLVFKKSTGENLYQVKTEEKFNIEVYANFMSDVRLGLYYSNGAFAEDIVSNISNNIYSCQVSSNIMSGSYIIQPYIIEEGAKKVISRAAGSHGIDRLMITVKNDWDEFSLRSATTEINNHILISTGQTDLLQIATGINFKVLVRYINPTSAIKIGLFNPVTGVLVSDITQSVEGNIFTCKVPASLADATYTIIPYQVINGYIVYVERLSDKTFLVDRLPLFVTLGEPEEPVIKAPAEVALYYTENSGTTVLAEYKGVRVGEYYWMNTPFMGNHIALSEPGWTGEYVYLRPWRTDYQNSMTVENVNLLHHRLLMFENARQESDRKSYFDQLLPGSSNSEKMIEFEKYYGTYLTRGHIQWMYDARPWVKILVEGENKEDKSWDLPQGYDIRQLLAMCGNATMAEVRQYLSYGHDQEDAPSVVKITPESYFDWFYHNPVNFEAQSNGFNVSNTNKYGFAMFPSGSKFHDASTYRPLTQVEADKYVISKGVVYPYQTKRGDFTGLNQTFALALHGSQAFILHDYPEIRSEKSYHWSPIRWCRQLTNEELGYKLYINQINFTDSREALVTLKSKIGNGETVIIQKLSLDQSPSTGFVELPRGYLRGFYVQYILGKSTPEKTIPQIVDIALQNPYVWGANNAPSSQSISTKVIEAVVEESSDLKVYPNPVTDILYLNSGESISEAQIYNTNGKLILRQTNIGSSLNVGHLASGAYILKLQIGDKSYTHKIIKK